MLNSPVGVAGDAGVSLRISADNMEGFGMGASWGDYNNDQVPDLFVSNMYSKAAKRIQKSKKGVR